MKKACNYGIPKYCTSVILNQVMEAVTPESSGNALCLESATAKWLKCKRTHWLISKVTIIFGGKQQRSDWGWFREITNETTATKGDPPYLNLPNIYTPHYNNYLLVLAQAAWCTILQSDVRQLNNVMKKKKKVTLVCCRKHNQDTRCFIVYCQ